MSDSRPPSRSGMRQHPLLAFWCWLFTSLLGGIALHPFLSPTMPLWMIALGQFILYLPVYGCWFIWPGILRFFRRLPRALAIASAEWKRQARYDFIAKERRRRRKAAVKAARQAEIERRYRAWQGGGYQPVGHIKPGVKPPKVVPATMCGHQPISTVDLTKVKPPQRPSPIAPQSQVLLPKTFEAYLEEHPDINRQEIEEKVERARRLWEGIFGQAADLPNFPQGVTLIGKPDPLPINPPYNPRINTIIGESTPPRCRPGEHKWMEALAFGTGRSYRVCSRCGVQRGKPKKGKANG